MCNGDGLGLACYFLPILYMRYLEGLNKDFFTTERNEQFSKKVGSQAVPGFEPANSTFSMVSYSFVSLRSIVCKYLFGASYPWR
jgi:hypothetical protein